MNKLPVPMKSLNKKTESTTVPFEPAQIFKSPHSADAPYNLPMDYICGKENARQSYDCHETFFHFIYGREAKNAVTYYTKHRLSTEYLKKNHLKKMRSYIQLSLSTSLTGMSAAMCKEALANPGSLALNYHVRCIVNFAGHYQGQPGLTLPELLLQHQNDDFRSTARRLLDDTADIDEDLLNSRFFGILTHWACQAYQLLTSGDDSHPQKLLKRAVLCWHAIAYLYKSRAMVLAGKNFPAHNNIDYFNSITASEISESDYDNFYEEHQNSQLDIALSQPHEPAENNAAGESIDIPGRIKQVSVYFLKESTAQSEDTEEKGLEQDNRIHIQLCQPPRAILKNIRQLLADESYTEALHQWSNLMTPEALALQRADVTRTAFQLLPTLLHNISQTLQEVANRFEIANLCFDLPPSLAKEALKSIDYNQLYLDVHEVLPRLQHPNSAMDELGHIIDKIDELTQEYCNHALEPGQMPPPSVIRILGATSLEIEEQMTRLADQWPILIEQILSEHSFALTLQAENNSHEEKNDIDLLAQIEQQKHQLIQIQSELRDAREANYNLARERDHLKFKEAQNTPASDTVTNGVSFKDVTQLLKQKVSYLDILNLADELYGERLVVLDSARNSTKELGLGQDHISTMARHLLQLVEEYLPAILAGQPDAQARKCFSTNVYCARESSTVATDASMAAQRKFTYNGAEHFFQQHLRVGKTIRIHFILDQDKGCVVIGHCGLHLRNQMTANQ